MDKFVRSALCRLCEFPVGSDGVRLSQLEIVKLLRWWKEELDTEFEYGQLEKIFFCQFCLWDAKYQGDSKDSEACDWWTGHDNNEFYRKNYYQAQLIRACAVQISPVALPQDSQNASTGRRSKAKKPTECIFCAESFESRRLAYRHVLDRHSDEVTFQCKKCYLHFLSKDEQKLHSKLFHPVKIMCHACQKYVKPAELASHISEMHFGYLHCCGKDFEDQQQLSTHFKSARSIRSSDCVYCEKTFAYKPNFLRHVHAAHSDISIKCQYRSCGKYFVTESQKQQHVSQAHEHKSECVYCELKVQALSQHVMSHHHSEAIRCTFNKKCCTYFKSESEREEHEVEVHFRTKLRRTLKCLQCGKSFCDRLQLTKHIRKKHQSEPMFCKTFGCCEYFLSERELRKHLEKHAADEAKKPFQCTECGYATRHKYNLHTHTLSKHRAGSFQCGTCEKTFKADFALKDHIAKIHTERKKCIHCGEAQRCLLRHLRVTPCRKCKFVAPCTSLRKRHCKKCIKP